jgi:hypothetical protein
LLREPSLKIHIGSQAIEHPISQEIFVFLLVVGLAILMGDASVLLLRIVLDI